MIAGATKINSKLLLMVSAMILWLATADATARQVSSTDFIADCSGCSNAQKKSRAMAEPWDNVLGDAPRRTFNVDVTDFHTRNIIRFEVTLDRLYRTGGVTPVPTTYSSAFELVGDNGSQELVFSNTLNGTQWPDTSSSLLAGLTIKHALEIATPMLLNFPGQDIKVVTAAFDGTIVIVEGDWIRGQGEEIRVLWHVAENGLRLADGNILRESTRKCGNQYLRTRADGRRLIL